MVATVAFLQSWARPTIGRVTQTLVSREYYAMDVDEIGKAAAQWIADGTEDMIRYERCRIVYEAIGDASGEVMVERATEFAARAGITVMGVRQQRDAWLLALRGSTPTVQTVKAASRLTTQGVKGLAEARDRLAGVRRTESDFIAEAERIWEIFDAERKARNKAPSAGTAR